MTKKGGLLVLVLSVLLVVTAAGCGKDNTGSSKEAYIIQNKPADMLRKLDAGEIDAFIAWEPFNAEAVSEGTGKYVVQSGDIWPGHPCCVLAKSSEFKDEDVLEVLVWAHIKAIDFIKASENKEKVKEYATEFTGKSEEIASNALSNIVFIEYPNREDFETYYEKLDGNGLLAKQPEDIGYSDAGELFDDFLRKDIYKDIKEKLDENPQWKPEVVESSTEVSLGYLNRDLHQLAFFVAQKEGYYEEAGLMPGENLVLNEYSNGVAVMEAFRAKEIDVSYLGGAPATLKRINDDISIQVLAGANNEGSAIVAGKDSDISSVKDLAGKTVAMPGLGTVQHFVLDMALRDEGITPVIE